MEHPFLAIENKKVIITRNSKDFGLTFFDKKGIEVIK